MDLNPVIVHADGCAIVDALIVGRPSTSARAPSEASLMSLQTLAQHDLRPLAGSAAEAARARIETRLFIDGNFVDAAKGGRFTTVNPATGETLAEMSAGTAEDIDRAVAAAKRAFKSGVWSRMAPRQRMEVLYRFATLIEQHAEALAVLETLDMGKPITDVVTATCPP